MSYEIIHRFSKEFGLSAVFDSSEDGGLDWRSASANASVVVSAQGSKDLLHKHGGTSFDGENVK